MQLTLERAAQAAEELRELPVTRRLPRDKAPSIAEQFWQFHCENPHVYDLLVKLARDVKARGKGSYGMKAIYERARWFYNIEKGDREFKLNNNFTAYYARLIMENEPDLQDFFETRKQRRTQSF